MAVPLTLLSVPAQTPYIQYVATSSQTVFPYPFEITQDSDLVCLINGVEQATDSGYTLSGQGATGGGNLTFTLGQTAGTIITLYRDISISRITQLAQNGTFFSSNFNNEYNRIYLIMQQLEQSIGFCLQVPNTNNPAPVTTLTPAAYANKYLSFDQYGNPQPAALTSSGTVTAALVGGFIYPISAAETAASITPTNYTYPWGAVDRYQTNAVPVTSANTNVSAGTSTATDMTVGFQAAINQARLGGADVTWGYSGTYLLATGALDCTFAGTGNQTGITFRQIGHASFDALGGIYVQHNAYTVFDMTGTDGFKFYDACIYTSSHSGSSPQTCWLTARNTHGGGCLPTFHNTIVQGYFSTAVLYNYSAEQGLYYGNRWYNYSTATGACVVAITATNYFKGSSTFMSSSYATIYSGSISCTVHRFIGGDYQMPGASNTSDLFYFEGGAAKIDISGCYGVCNNGAAGGRSVLYFDNTNAGCGRASINDFRLDDSGFFPSYGVYISGTHAFTDLTIKSCYLPHATNYLCGAGSEVIENTTIIQPSWSTTNGGVSVYEAVGCSFHTGSMSLTVGNSENNLYVGTLANWTITTPIGGDIKLDTGAGAISTGGNVTGAVVKGTTSLLSSGGIGLNGSAAQAQVTGWGTPTGASVEANFAAGSGQTMAVISAAVAKIITDLKACGFYGA